jgi:voltage-gated potassium channel
MAIYRCIVPRVGRRRLKEWRRRGRHVMVFRVAIILLCAVGLAVLDNSDRPLSHKLFEGL